MAPRRSSPSGASLTLPPAVVAIVAEAAQQNPECRQRLFGYLEGRDKDPTAWHLVVDAAHLEPD